MIDQERFDHVSEEIRNLFEGVSGGDAIAYKNLISTQIDLHQIYAIISEAFGGTLDQTKENAK